MKTIKFGIKDGIIVVLVLLSSYLYFFDRCDKETITVVRTDTIPGDTEYVEVKVPSPPTVVRVREATPGDIQRHLDTIFVDRIVDSMQIFRNYFNYYYRIDSVSQNECHIIIEDTITQNKIIYERIQVKNTRPIAINTTEINTNIKARKLYLGAFVNTHKFDGKKFGIGPYLGLQDKKDNIYTYGYDITNETHNIGVLFKIKLKK